LNLIVETNFKVYAYSNSDLHIDLLNLFAELNYRLPNLIVASLTERSIKTAYKTGIRKEQIVKFLNKNIHTAQKTLVEKEKIKVTSLSHSPSGDILEKIRNDSMYHIGGDNMMPENILQQLEMWEREKDLLFEEDGNESD
jgi:transcription initiation factor TFIIH subunit 4